MYQYETPNTADRRIIKVVEAMNTNPGWPLVKFAQMVNLSKSRLMHLFKEHMGISISEYLREKKLNYAAELLRLTELRIKEVAYETGYDHPQSFVRAFKNRYAITPTLFRDRLFANRHSSHLSTTLRTAQPIPEIHGKTAISSSAA